MKVVEAMNIPFISTEVGQVIKHKGIYYIVLPRLKAGCYDASVNAFNLDTNSLALFLDEERVEVVNAEVVVK